MRRLIPAAFVAVVTVLGGIVPAMSAEGLGTELEKEAVIKGQVVDVLCVLQGGKDCPPNCGGGRRQLGLLINGTELRPVMKGPALFAGAHLDLLPYCGKTIITDGLMIENPKMRVYQVQGIKTDESQAAFTPADAFEKDWVARNGPSDEWFRADPMVKSEVARRGVLGRPDLQPKP